MNDLLQQLPAMLHQELKKEANAAGEIVIRVAAQGTYREGERKIWQKLETMVKTAAKKTIPEKLGDNIDLMAK